MNGQTLIADSGSTKTDWALGTVRVRTQGINPFHQDATVIRAVLRNELTPQLEATEIRRVAFYGSGVRPELEEKMVSILREFFPQAVEIEAHGDLLGAARALCGHEAGIACILGTGANSCLYDGKQIVSNIPPLGYILGDEGSGAVLGRNFLNSLYKNRLSSAIREEFEATQAVKMADVIERVYRQPMANRWLASLSVFIHRHLCEPEVKALVMDNFRDFIVRNIVPYHRPDLPVSAVGSIAYYFREQLCEVAKKEGYTVGRILHSPLDALVEMEDLG
ncbi:MAG: ATPase [Prevotella sp.]|nr:ATPase [Prevotella sp.]